MDLESLKTTADAMHDMYVTKQNALEKLRGRQVLVYQDHVFRADAETITLVKVLLEQRPQQALYILDCNQNPCEIKNAGDFLDKLLERHQESVNDYHKIYQTFKKRVK
jgi:anion-transporting  ArsA/GET3 family ATPase